MTHSPDHVNQALLSASVELAMGVPMHHSGARAVLLRCFWIHDDPGESRIALALADLRSTRAPSQANPGVLAVALADRVRHALLNSGSLPCVGSLDDYPSAPLMVNDDVCSINCAVRFGPGQSPFELDIALGQALDAMFLAGFHFRRHLRSSQAGEGQLGKTANALIFKLRTSLAAQGSI